MSRFFLQCSVLKLIYWLTFNYLWFFSSGCYYFLFIHVAGALAEKGCSLDEVAGAAQELADSIGMIYLIIYNVHCDCLAYMYIIVMVSVDHGWVYCQFIVAFFNHTIAVYFYVKCTILFVI